MHILFWIFKSRINRSGQVPIIMRITLNGKRTELSTNLFIDPQIWDTHKQRIRGNTPIIKEYNNTISNLRTAAWNHYNNSERLGKNLSPEGVRDLMLNKNKPSYSLMEVFRTHIQNLEKRVGFDISVNTIKKYRTVENKLKLFLRKEMNRSDVSLIDVTGKFITELDSYMKLHDGLKRNAIVKNMQQLRGVIKNCLQNGWIEKDPFMRYSFKMDDTERGYLTLQELKVIEEVKLLNVRLDNVRDVFVFCCYTGLAYADVSKLSKIHFEEGPDSITWIKLNRTKSKSRSVIPLLPRAREILEKYKDFAKSNPNKTMLPIISNQNLNKYLKEVAVLCGINKRVSVHLARHTFATTVTLERGIDIMTVSKMLGHKNLRTTQVYSKVTELKIAEDMKKLM